MQPAPASRLRRTPVKPPLSAEATRTLALVRARPGLRVLKLAQMMGCRRGQAEGWLTTLAHRGLVHDEEFPDPEHEGYTIRRWFPGAQGGEA